MSANQNKTTPTETAQQVVRSIWKSLALLCLLALSALPALAQDLGVTQTGAPQPVGAGTNLTYSITVTNAGVVDATAVTLADTLPSQVTYVSDTGGGTLTLGVLTCSLGTIPVGGSTNISVIVSTACGSIGQVTNTVVALEMEVDANYADNTNTVINTVSDLTGPVIATCAPDQTVCPNGGGTATVPDFTAGVVASDACSGPVTVTQSPLAGSTVSSGTTVITLTATDSATPPNSSTCLANFVVRTNVSATALASALNSCPGSSVTFTTTASGSAPITYSWTKNGVTISGQTTSSLTVSPVTAASVGTYRVTATGPCNSVTQAAPLTVAPAAAFVLQPKAALAPVGGGAAFSATVSSPLAVNYQWRSNGVDIAAGASVTGTTTPSMTISNLTFLANNAQITLVASNCAGAVSSSIAVLSVRTNFVTMASQASGTNWGGLIWSNLPSATGLAPIAGNIYEAVPNGVLQAGNTANTRLRNPATDGTQTFPGDALIVDANAEIRFKKGASNGVTFPFVTPTICNFPGVSGNPGLILNGALLNPGDDATFPIAGAVSVASDSILGLSDGGVNSATPTPLRGLQFTASLRGTGSLIVVNGVTNFANLEVTSANNSYSGNWIVKAGWLKGTGSNSLGSGNITLDTAYAVSSTLLTPAAVAALISGPIRFEVNYNIDSPGTLTLNGDAQIILHQDCRFAKLIISGTQVPNGFYDYSTLAATYPTNFPAGGSGSISVGPAAPSGLTALSGDALAYLSWTGTPDALNYVIYRSLVSGSGYLPVTTNPPNSTTYYDRALDNGTTYYYVVTALNAGGESAMSNEAAVTPAVVAPTISVNPVNTTNCTGLASSFSVTAGGAFPLLYQWYFNTSTALANQTNSTLTLNNLVSGNAGNYSVIVSNSDGSITSSVAVLVVKQATVAVGPVSVTNCPGDTVTFTTTASGAGTLTYTWRKGSTIVQDPSTNNANTYSLFGVTSADAATYSVTVVGDCNTVSNNFTLTITAPPVITVQPQPQFGPMGNGVVFSVTATASGTLSYAWKSNGVTVSGATSSTLAVSNLTLVANGAQYQVTVTDCAGSTASTTVTLSVNPISAVSFDFNTPGQWTNAPYNLVNIDWMGNTLLNQQPFGPITEYETATGGVASVAFPRGNGALDLAFNTGNDQTMIFTPLFYDFSLTGQVLNASVMLKLKLAATGAAAPTPHLALGFLTGTNGNGNIASPPTAGNLVGLANIGFMSSALRATNIVNNNTNGTTLQFLSQTKPTNGTTTVTTTNTVATIIGTNHWYKYVVQFVNTKGPGVLASNFTTAATLQDMGLDGQTPGAIVLQAPVTTSTNFDIVNSPRLLFAIRTLENGGLDYLDNLYVTTSTGLVAFVQQPTNQVVRQGELATFNALVNGDGPFTYQWSSNGVPIPGAGNWKYITVPQRLANIGDSYTVTVTSTNNTITSSGATIGVTAKTFAVVSVGSVDGGVVGLRFSRPVDPVTAQDPTKYLINGVAATSAQLLVNNNIQQQRTNGTEVLLTPASSLSGAFTVTVSGVQSVEGDMIGSPNDTASGSVAGLIGLDINPTAYGLLDEIATYPGWEYSFAPGAFTVSGGGHDLFNAIDGFRYVYSQRSGDFDIKMRIPYLDALRTPNKCGIDIRASLEPWSEMVYAGVNPALPGRQEFEGTVRQVPYSFAVSFGGNATAQFPNAWLRVRRVGNTILRYSSANGVNWTFDAQTSPYPSLPNTVYVGIAVCANVGQRTLQQPVLAQIDNYGDFAGYGNTNTLAVVGPTNQTAAAGSAITMTAIATVTGGGIPNNGGGEVGFLWQRTNSAAGGWTNMPNAGQTTTAVGASQTSVTNTLSTGNLLFTDNNAQYRAIVSAPGAVSVIGPVGTMTVTDIVSATIVSSSIGDVSLNRLILNFSEFLSAGTALNANNYIVTNSLGVTQGIASVSFQNGNPLSVVLTMSNAVASGSFFALVTTNVTDLNGNRIAAGTVRQFIASAALTPTLASGPGLQGPVVIDWYTSLRSDGSTKDLVNAWKYKSYNPLPDGQADFVVYSNVFGIHPASFPSPGWADNYGARMYSYFLAPTSGVYRFYTRADDFAEFIMNTNNAPGTDSRAPMDRIIGVGSTTAGTVGPGNVQAGTNTPNFQSVWSLEDNNVNTKYLQFFGAGVNSGYIVTPASGPSVVNGIRFTSAGDAPERDPATFTIEGTSADPRSGSTVWNLLAAGATGMSSTNATNRLEIKSDIIFTNAATGNYTNTTFYSHYRVLFPSLRGTTYTGVATAPNSMQIAEVNLLGTNGASTTPVKITPGGAVIQVTMTVNNANYVAANSATNTLNGGQLYYMEFRFKEGGGGDGATVAMRNDTTVPAAAEVISNNFLVFPTNLAPATPVICEIYAQVESHSASVPFLTTAPAFTLPGVAAANGNLGDLSVSTNFPRFIARLPNTVGYCETMGFNTNLVSGNSSFENYLGKVYSYLVAPSNGLYRFYLRSDDSSQLWMNTNAVNSTDPNGIKLLGSVPAFNGTYTLQGQNVALTGGQRYYMEIRWREGTGGDGVSVAMRAQADAAVPATSEQIPGSFFEYPTNHIHTGPIGIEGILPNSPTVNAGDQITFQAREISGSGSGLGGGIGTTSPGGTVNTIGCVWLKNGNNLFNNMVYQTNEYWVTPPVTLADDGAVITLLISNSFSIATASATVHVAAASAPLVTNAVASQYFDSVVLTFNRNLDSYTSQQLANYSIGGLQVLSVARDDWQRNRVILHTSTQTASTIYTVTVNNVKEGSGTLAIAPNSQIQFSSWAFGGQGGVLVEIFTNVLNTLDNFFTQDPKGVFNLPDIAYYTNVLSIAVGTAAPNFVDMGLNFYAARISGLYIAPSNGFYRFYCRGDDATQIYMNTNGPSPAGRVLICRNDGANSGGTTIYQIPNSGGTLQSLNGFETGVGLGMFGASISPIISLTNGMPYYMEILMKEGSGGDYVQVAMHAVDPTTRLDITPWANAQTPAVADNLSAGNFSAPGNPDLTGIATRPAAVTNIVQNRLMTLAVTLKPAGVVGSFQWSKSINNGATFAPISGATSASYSQYVDLPDEGAIFRVDVNMPGGNPFATTLLHVIADTNNPTMISAGSIDPFHVGVTYSERMDFADVKGSAGDYQLYFLMDSSFNIVDVFNGLTPINPVPGDPNHPTDGSTAILSLDHALVVGSNYIVVSADFADIAGNENTFDGDPTGRSASFTVMNLFAQDIGADGTTGAGAINRAAVPAYPLNPFPSTNGGFDVTANGWDIWNATDGFHFDWLNRPMVGNFDLKVRVQRLDPADQWSKAGLMIRGSTNANARWIYIINTPTNTPVAGQVPNNFSSLQWRDFDGAGAAPNLGNINGLPPVAYPNAWLRLQRVGNVFNGYQSSNAVDWVLVASRDTATTGYPFPESMVFGFCTVSHDQLADNLTRNAYAEYRDVYIPAELPTITAQPGPLVQTNVVHTTVSYTVAATNPANSGPLVYQWLKNGVAIPGANGATLTLANLKVTDSGLYSVTPANDGGGTPSVVLALGVTNVLPTTVPESLVATQGMTYTFNASDLLANDFDPDTDTLTLVSVSGVGVNSPQVATNFNQGPLVGSTLYGGAPTGGVWLATGGVGGSGGIQINSAALNNAGSYILDELTPGVPVSSFIVSFNLRVGEGTAEPADGMSVNFANDLPIGATTPGAAEQGGGSGFTFAIDDYRFFPPPTIGTATVNGGTNNTSGMKLLYHGLHVAVQQCPTFAANPTFVPVTITVADNGTATVMVNGTNVFGTVTLPGYAPATGRFGFYGRDGGQGESHTIDDLSITLNPHQQTALGGTVSLNNGVVTYIAPTNACGPDIFYYTISDGQLGGTVVDHVSIVVYPTNNTAPIIASCPSNRVVAVGATCQAALPDVTGDLIVVDQCSGVIKSQSPAAGTMSGLGTTLVTLTASNIVGSNVTCQMYVTNADLTAPTIGCPADIVAECTGNGANVNYSVSSSDNCSTPIVNCTPVPSGGHFPLGTNTVNCTSTDAAGNVSSCSFKVIVLDTTPPVLTCPNVVAQCTGPAGANVSFTPSVVEACDPSPSVVCTPASGSAFGFGATPVHCTATDATGNIGTCDFTVTVRDTIAPAFVCPANQTNECTGAGGAVGTYTTPGAADTCDPSPTVSCSPASGTTFAIGTNTVTCIAYDVSLNTNTCTFKIITVDTTPPSISCSSDKSVECGLAWTFDAPTALDTCGATHIHNLGTVTNHTCGNTFTATRTWNFTDDAGNTSVNCSQTVTVVDTTAPTITCSPNLTNNCTSVNGAVVTFTVTATDICGPNPTPVCTPPSGSTFSVGVHTVDCVATDACGNASSHCSFTVTVRDTASAPTMTIVQSGSNVIISWPATCTTYRLQRSTSLPNWSDFISTTVLNGSTYYSTNAINTSARFYRLLNP